MTFDGKKEIGSYRARAGRFDTVTVPPLQFLMTTGQGDPNSSPDYAAALATLYAVAYGLKFRSRKEYDRDVTVMPLEGLWWAEDLSVFTHSTDRSQWRWTMMIMVPDWITQDDLRTVESALTAAGKITGTVPVTLGTLAEGLVVQTLHIGPYSDEGPVLRVMHDQILPERGFRPTGHHHEVYLGDPRRSAPERLRTILRQPVEPL
ncbi:MAG: GyrI-like domain-containing protein [Mycetocola sp.]